MDRQAEAAHSRREPPGLRDAREIARRIAADEAEADAERTRLEHESLPVLQLDEASVPVELHRETVHAIRRLALLDGGAARSIGGTLYLTSTRLLHVGDQVTTAVPLQAITEVSVALERLLLIGLAGGLDLAIEVAKPRLLCVQVDAAVAAASTGQV